MHASEIDGAHVGVVAHLLRTAAGDQTAAEEYLGKAQAVCERAGLEPDALMVLPFLC